MTFNGGHLLVIICRLRVFFGEMFVQVFGPFFYNWVVFLLLNFKSSMYILKVIFYQMFLLQIFSLSVGLVFSSHFLDINFCRVENFNFNDIQLINSFVHGLCCISNVIARAKII